MKEKKLKEKNRFIEASKKKTVFVQTGMQLFSGILNCQVFRLTTSPLFLPSLPSQLLLIISVVYRRNREKRTKKKKQQNLISSLFSGIFLPIKNCVWWLKKFLPPIIFLLLDSGLFFGIIKLLINRNQFLHFLLKYNN